MATATGENEGQPQKVDHLISHELEFRSASLSHSQKGRQFLYQQTGLQNINLIMASTTLTTFIFTPTVRNDARCVLEYDLFIPAQGAGRYSWVPRDRCEADNIVYFNQENNVQLINLQYADRYMNSVAKVLLSQEEMQKVDDPFLPYIKSNALNTSNTQLRNDMPSAPGQMNYDEFRYWDVSPTPNTDFTVSRKVPLGIFKGTYFEQDRSVAFMSNMQLNWTWLSGQNMGFTTTSNQDPYTGATAFTLGAAAGNPPVQIQNLRIVLYLENDMDIKNQLMAEAASGDQEIPVSFPYNFMQNFPNAGAQVMATIINPAHGARIQRVVGVPYIASGVAVARYNHSNLQLVNPPADAQTLVTQVQSFINSMPLQDAPLLPGVQGGAQKYEDYYWLRDKIKPSIIGAHPFIYARNWLWMDDFTGVKPQEKVEGKYETYQIVSGVPNIGAQTRHEMRFTTTAALDVYVWVICQRVLNLSPPAKGGVRVY